MLEREDDGGIKKNCNLEAAKRTCLRSYAGYVRSAVWQRHHAVPAVTTEGRREPETGATEKDRRRYVKYDS